MAAGKTKKCTGFNCRSLMTKRQRAISDSENKKTRELKQKLAKIHKEEKRAKKCFKIFY
jgi:hypothetical protein